MTFYTERGQNIFVGSSIESKVHDKLPTNTYLVSYDSIQGYYLTVAPKFEIPNKIYGDAVRLANRFLYTFLHRKGTTGVLLAGTKGSGKSLVMKMASVYALEHNVPTLIVASAHCGEKFNGFIQSIDQPCVVIFDEFEKVFDEEQQQSLLTLFDGTFTTQKLMIVTCNNHTDIDSNMINRPGRMFYYIKYTGLSESFIKDYCEDRLDDKTKINPIIILSSFFNEFNFDMLQALVEELNRFPEESINQVVSLLNINYDSYRAYYNVTLIEKDGNKIIRTKETVSNPLQQEKLIFQLLSSENEEGDCEETSFSIDSNIKINQNLSVIRIENEIYSLVLTKVEPKKMFDLSSLLE